MTIRTAVLFLVASLSFALPHGSDSTSFRHDTWQSAEGLPHDVVRGLAQTPDGYLWIGMTNALARYDGSRIVRVAGAKLVSTQITAVATDRSGQLVVGTLSGLFRLKGSELTSVDVKPGVSSIRGIATDRDGYIWAATELGLFRVGGSPAKAVQFLPDVYVNKAVVGADGSVWAASKMGLFRIPPGASPGSPVPPAILPGQSVMSVMELGNGQILVGTDGNGLWAVDADSKARRIFSRELGNIVMALRRDQTGNLWVGTWDRGLYLVSNSVVSQPAQDLGEGVQVTSIFEDREGNIWAGSRGTGLHRLRRHLIHNLTTADGLPHALAWAVAESIDGTVWIGTDGGLAYVRAGRVRHFTEAEGLPPGVVTTVASAPDGTVYAGTPGRGIWKIRGDRAVKLDIPEALGANLNHVFVDRDNQLWLSNARGMLVVQGQTVVRRYTKAEGLPANSTRSVSQGKEGTIWAATSKGIVRLRGGEMTVFGASQGLLTASIRSVTHGADGTVWAATQGGGVCRLEGENFRCYGTAQGLGDPDIYSALPDRFGFLWLTTANGLFRVPQADFDRVRDGTAREVSVFRLGQADGMGTDSCTGGIQPAAHITAAGRLWVPTLKGVSVLDLNRRLRAVDVSPMVESVRLGDDSPRNVEIQFTAPMLSGAGVMRFRYKLEPFDSDWVVVSSRRSAFYTNLPPGSYRFRVAVRNQDSDWVEAREPVPLDIAPTIYETLWFRLLCVCVGLAAVLLFVRVRLNAAASRRAELTRMVEERTRELEQARTRLEQADRAKSNFLSFISHEIRTPLNGILAMTSLWHTFRSEDEHVQALQTIESCGEALLGIVNNVLDLTRIEAGRLDLEESVWSPASLVERALAVVSMQAARKNLEIRTCIEPGVPESVYVDGTRLRQVILNLLSNAVKFSQQGVVELAMGAEAEGDGHWRLRFRVSDTGIGIPPEALPHLFEPFTHASSSTTRRFGGSGLGLSISLRIVRAMHGDIRVESEVGKGSTFDFDVQVREANMPPVNAPAEVEDNGDALVDSPEVLVVEDNRVNQLVARKMLTLLGCRVHVVNSGSEALLALADATRTYRVVFMDCMMPDLDGYETTRRIRQMPERSGLPIVAMTADAFSGSRDRAFASGMNSYLTKPLRIEEVRRELAIWTTSN
ncbi:MAG: two-component regulator propeller domain-containing protein [Bryobacteraceae bacterium]|nr:two-component regulator propeller domain-containing protein [Bryobacteraceae bacterium]